MPDHLILLPIGWRRRSGSCFTAVPNHLVLLPQVEDDVRAVRFTAVSNYLFSYILRSTALQRAVSQPRQITWLSYPGPVVLVRGEFQSRVKPPGSLTATSPYCWQRSFTAVSNHLVLLRRLPTGRACTSFTAVPNHLILLPREGGIDPAACFTAAPDHLLLLRMA